MFFRACLLWMVCGLIHIQVLAQNSRIVTINGTDASIELVLIPAGIAKVGLDDAVVNLEMDAFWMGVEEVTYEQFQPFRDRSFDANESVHGTYDADAVTRPTPQYIDFTYGMGAIGGFPAVSMTQQAALRYCKWLYEKTGVFFRLPTEAEWEYACRAGDESRAELKDMAWYAENSSEKYHPTRQKVPNDFGLYDMLGNVMEYTAEQFANNWPENLDPAAPHKVQSTPSEKYFRAVRGGAFDDDASACSCTSRVKSSPRWQRRDPQIPKSIWWNPDSPFAGFRVVAPEGEYTREQVMTYFEKVIVD